MSFFSYSQREHESSGQDDDSHRAETHFSRRLSRPSDLSTVQGGGGGGSRGGDSGSLVTTAQLLIQTKCSRQSQSVSMQPSCGISGSRQQVFTEVSRPCRWSLISFCRRLRALYTEKSERNPLVWEQNLSSFQPVRTAGLPSTVKTDPHQEDIHG